MCYTGGLEYFVLLPLTVTGSVYLAKLIAELKLYFVLYEISHRPAAVYRQLQLKLLNNN